MEPLVIEGTKSTPSIILDKGKGLFQFTGNSIPEDAMGFYQPVIGWVNEYLKIPNPNTELLFKMSYFNTASSKILFELIKQFVPLKSSENSIKVNWYYSEEDEDMLEVGKDYEELTNLPFDFISQV
jgi:hypothetical protein